LAQGKVLPSCFEHGAEVSEWNPSPALCHGYGRQAE